MRLLLVIVLVTEMGGALRLPMKKVQRLPLQRKGIVLKSPITYSKRVLGTDPKTGEETYYDPKPKVILLDAKAGKYALRWIGYDGQEKTIIYQVPDVIDAVVTASATKTTSGKYMYVYNIENLQSSGEHLSIFAAQTFASDVKPVKLNNVYVGPMSNNREMKEGNWIGFGILSSFSPIVGPGQKIELKLESSAPPGLVECRIAGGKQGMKGVGEEPPQELENVLPGYEAWPRGYTIGPVDYLKTLSPKERLKYVHESLPQFQRLGWMGAEALTWYEQNLTPINLGLLHKRANEDFKAGRITSELFAMIRSIR